MHTLKYLKNIMISISIPLGIFIIFQVFCSITGEPYINSSNFRAFIINIVYVALIGWALFFNIPAGRFDFSIGSIIVLSPMIGGHIALMLDLGAAGLIIFCILIGLFLGAVSGIIYVLLKLPAMVTSLGITLIFEAFTIILYDGKGTVLIGRDNMLYMIQFPYIFILTAVVMIFLIIIINFTGFGYNLRALSNGQQISVNTGINEISNAIISYSLSGALSAIAGVTVLSRTGTVSATLGLASIMSMFLGFLPMFIGGILARYSEPVTGILLGAVATSFISSGFAALGLSLSAQNIFNAFILLGFLVFALNQDMFKEFAIIRKRKHAAIQKYDC